MESFKWTILAVFLIIPLILFFPIKKDQKIKEISSTKRNKFPTRRTRAIEIFNQLEFRGKIYDLQKINCGGVRIYCKLLKFTTNGNINHFETDTKLIVNDYFQINPNEDEKSVVIQMKDSYSYKNGLYVELVKKGDSIYKYKGDNHFYIKNDLTIKEFSLRGDAFNF